MLGVLDKGNFRTRKTLKPWHSNTNEANNRESKGEVPNQNIEWSKLYLSTNVLRLCKFSGRPRQNRNMKSLDFAQS